MIVIKAFSHTKISKVGVENLGDDTVEEYMWGYLDDDNVVVYADLFFWI